MAVTKCKRFGRVASESDGRAERTNRVEILIAMLIGACRSDWRIFG